MYATALLSALALLVSSSPASAAPTAEKRLTYVQFTNDFPSVIHPGDDINLTWTGGDGRYDVFAQFNYAESTTSTPLPFVRNSTDTSFLWHAADTTYQANTTVYFGVVDSDEGSPNEPGWYGTSPTIPIENC